MQSPGDRVAPKDRSDLSITGVSLLNGAGKESESFLVGEDLSVQIVYEARKEIENPVFSLEVIRADGVLCCASSTKESGVSVGTIKGNGSVKVAFGKVDLGPGIYAVKVSVWDRDLIHAYDTRKDNVFRVGAKDLKTRTEAVFLKPMEWGIGDK